MMVKVSLVLWIILVVVLACCCQTVTVVEKGRYRFSPSISSEDQLKTVLHTSSDIERDLQIDSFSLTDSQWLDMLHQTTALQWSRLHLSAVNTELSPMFYRILAKHFLSRIQNLQSLHIQQQNIDVQQMKLIVQALRKQSRLEYLTFSHCQLSSEAVDYLTILLNVRKTVKYLDLHSNRIDGNGLQTLLSSWQAGNGKALEHLDLSHNHKLGKHLHLLAQAIQAGNLPNLKVLILREVGGGMEDIAKLLEGLAESSVQLEVLDLSGNACMSSKSSQSSANKASYLPSKLGKMLPTSFRKALDSMTESSKPTLRASQAVTVASSAAKNSKTTKPVKIRTATFRQTDVRLAGKKLSKSRRNKASLVPNPSYMLGHALLRFLYTKRDCLQTLQLNRVHLDEAMATMISNIATKEFSNNSNSEQQKSSLKLLSLRLNPSLSSEQCQTLETILRSL